MTSFSGTLEGGMRFEYKLQTEMSGSPKGVTVVPPPLYLNFSANEDRLAVGRSMGM